MGDKHEQAEEGTNNPAALKRTGMGLEGMHHHRRRIFFVYFVFIVLFYDTGGRRKRQGNDVGVGISAGMMSLRRKNGMDGIHITSRDTALFTSKNILFYRREFRGK